MNFQCRVLAERSVTVTPRYNRHRMDIYEELVRLRNLGQKCALATIVEVRGSIPSYESAKLLVREDGSMTGTIGGGCVEAEVWNARPRGYRNGKAQAPHLQPGPGRGLRQRPDLRRTTRCVRGAGAARAARVHLRRGTHLQEPLQGGDAGRVRHAWWSTIARPSPTASAFPRPPRSTPRSTKRSSRSSPINETSYLIIVTRGHRDDMRVLQLAIATPARYIAMIGSKRKVLNVIRELEKEGIARTAFERIHAPMGLDIGAISPEEIAISVTAEMIAVRRNAASNWRSLSLSVFAGERERAVLAK